MPQYLGQPIQSCDLLMTDEEPVESGTLVVFRHPFEERMDVWTKWDYGWQRGSQYSGERSEMWRNLVHCYGSPLAIISPQEIPNVPSQARYQDSMESWLL